MSMTDPDADMLTRVRNACQAGHRRVDMPVSKLKVEIARLLRDNHYVQDFKVLDDGRHGLLRLYLKYHNDAPVIRELQRVSAPGLRRYVKAREIPRVKNGLGMAILSTPQGIKMSVDNNVVVKIEGVDKELVGQVAAEIRAIRPPEPYKGKGIRYAGEQVRRKAGKTAQAAK